MKYSLKHLVLLLLFLQFLSCVSADKNSQKILIKPNIDFREKWISKDSYSFNKGGLDFEILFLKPNSSIIYGLFSNFIVDDFDSAIHHLSANYLVTIGLITNKSGSKKTFYRNELHIPFEGSTLSPLLPNDYPAKIFCINWKGNLKNLYNLTVVTVTTAIIVTSLMACLKEGKCEGLQHIDKIIKLSRSGEKNLENSFSNPIFASNMEYLDIEKFQNIVVNPGEKNPFCSCIRGPSYH